MKHSIKKNSFSSVRATLRPQFASAYDFKKYLLFFFIFAITLTSNAAEDTKITVNNINYCIKDPYSVLTTNKIKEAENWLNKYYELAKEEKLNEEDKKTVKRLKKYIKKADGYKSSVIEHILKDEIKSRNIPDPNRDYIAVCTGSQHAYGDIVIPEFITYNDNEYKVVEISDNAFRECHGMRMVSIPYSIVKIGTEAFYDCNSLTYLHFPNSVKVISYKAFAKCTSLMSISLPDSLTYIAGSMLSDCNNLTSITIPNSVTTICESAFENCTNLKDVNIPNSVTTIGESAFANCTNLKDVGIPNSVTRIGSSAFANCINLKKLTLSNSVVEIGSEAFLNCSSLTDVTIPNSAKNIKHNAFAKCTNLKSIRWNIMDNQLDFSKLEIFEDCDSLQTFIFCNGIKRIPDNICREMYYLKNVTIPKSVIRIGNDAFYGCISLESISIPDSTEEIGERAFKGCLNLNNVIIPNSVTTIHNQAFMGSGLTNITIPNSVTKIGSEAFADCFRINEEVIIPSSVNYMGDDVFGGILGYKSIILPNNEEITGWALKWYNKALNGDPIAQHEMALCYLWGMGTNSNNKLDIYWAKRAAQQYHPLGLKLLNQLLHHYNYCNYLTELLHKEAIKRAIPMAKKGSAEAQFVLGSLQNNKEMLKKSCMQGFSWAQIDYQRDYDKEAINWLKQLAQQGHPMAQNNLGWYYHYKDVKQAEFWYKKAIKQAGDNFYLPRKNLENLKR